MELIGTACERCGVVASIEDATEVKDEDHDGDGLVVKQEDGDAKPEVNSSSIGKTNGIVRNPFGRTNTGTFQETVATEQLSGSSRDSTPFSVLDDEGVAGVMSDVEDEPAPFVPKLPVVGEIEMPSTPSKKQENVEEKVELINGTKKQQARREFEYLQSPVSNHAPVVKLPAKVHEHIDTPSTPAPKHAIVEPNPTVINGGEEQDLAGGFEYVHSPVKNHVAKVRLPIERNDFVEVIEKSLKSSPLQATAQPFVPLQASPKYENSRVASPADKHQESKSNGVGAEITREEVDVTLLASLPQKPIKVLDRCSRFQPLETRVESGGETVEQKKLAKYTPPMLWKHASAENENDENTWTAPKVKESTMMNGKSIHDDDPRAPFPRIALSPIAPYNNNVASRITVNDSLEHNGNTLAEAEGDLVTDSFPALSAAFNAAVSSSHMNAGQASSIRLPRAPVSAPKAFSNGVNRNKVPFLPSKSEIVIIKEETMDAETEKLKKLQRTLATLAITQEVEVIFAKVQREQKIKLEDWFANVAPMHLASMEKAVKNSRDRDTQVKALRASFVENGKFLSGMLVDQLLADAKNEVVRMCEEGVEKLVNSLL